MGLIGVSVMFFVGGLALLGYFLVDCRRRPSSAFPSFTYGSTIIEASSAKRLWTWFLVGSFVFGVAFSQEVWREWETANTQVPQDARSYREEIVFYTYELTRVDEDNVYRSVTLKFPLLFLVGLGVYHRCVRRWDPGPGR